MAILGTVFGFILGVILTILMAIIGFFGFIWSDSTAVESDYDTGTWAEYAVPAVVDAPWLDFELETNPDLVIVAIADSEDYEAGHIPGAIRIAPEAIEIAGTEDPAWQEGIETALGGAGITVDSVVVVYDYGDMNAARLWWALTRLSHPAVSVLDGGMTAWEAGDRPVDIGVPLVDVATTVYYGLIDYSLVATTADVEASLDDDYVAIIDARSPSEYAAGHIPGAINIPAADNFGPDGALLPADELFALYVDAGVTPDLQVIVYCNSGILSSNTSLALNSLGYWSVQIYAGSWSEWTSDPVRPVGD